jgi:hypothetical protein
MPVRSRHVELLLLVPALLFLLGAQDCGGSEPAGEPAVPGEVTRRLEEFLQPVAFLPADVVPPPGWLEPHDGARVSGAELVARGFSVRGQDRPTINPASEPAVVEIHLVETSGGAPTSVALLAEALVGSDYGWRATVPLRRGLNFLGARTRIGARVSEFTVIRVESLSGGEVAGRPIPGALPVRVQGKDFRVVPVSSLPPALRQSLDGVAAWVAVDSPGRVARPEDGQRALVVWHVVRTLIDDPSAPGWDTRRAESSARQLESLAETFVDIQKKTFTAAVASEIRNLAARGVVLSLAGAKGLVVPGAGLIGLFEEIVMDPKNVARYLLHGDLGARASQLRLAAAALRGLGEHPVEYRVARDLLEADMYGLSAAADAALARAALERADLPAQLWETARAAFSQGVREVRGLGREQVEIPGKLASLILKGEELLRQVAAWEQYEKAVAGDYARFIGVLDSYRRLAEETYEVANARRR